MSASFHRLLIAAISLLLAGCGTAHP